MHSLLRASVLAAVAATLLGGTAHADSFYFRHKPKVEAGTASSTAAAPTVHPGTVHVSSASYGATSSWGTHWPNEENALSAVKAICEGNASCSFTVDFALTGGSDPWPGAAKGFQMAVSCSGGGPTTYIDIGGAVDGQDAYGRTVSHACGG